MKSHLHVKIDDSKEKQKLILLSAKTLTEQLKDYNSLKSIREEKKKKLLAFKKLMGDILAAFKELKVGDVPFIKLQDEEEEIKPAEEKKVREVVPRMSKEELQFSRELADIDRKLSSL